MTDVMSHSEQEEIRLYDPDGVVTNSHLDTTIARLELRLSRVNWMYVLPGVGLAITLLISVWGLAIDPIKDQLAAHNTNLSNLQQEVQQLEIQTARMADSLDWMRNHPQSYDTGSNK